MYKLTALDIAAIRSADRLVVVLNNHDSRYRETGVRLIKEAKKSTKTPFPSEQEHELLDAPVSVRGFHYHTSESREKACAFAMVYLYHSQNTPESSIVRQLRAGDNIEFVFHADMHTNGYVAAAGLHADVLLLNVERGEGKNRKRLSFEIDSSVCPNNPARMIRGLVESAQYYREGARCRKENWTPPPSITVAEERRAV